MSVHLKPVGKTKGENTMKKTVCMVLVGLALTLTLTGCPATNPGGSSQDGPQPNSSKIVVSGNLYGGGEKSLTSTQIGDLLKTQIMDISIWLSEDPTVPPSQTYAYEEPFVLTVDQNGNYYGEFLVEPASYNIWVEARDDDANPEINNGYGKTIFWDSIESFQVASGTTTQLDILLKFMDAYYFEFWVNDLPGTYPVSGDALIINNLSEHYYTGYDKSGGILYFWAWLPLDFDGFTSILEITDSNGDTYSTDLNFDLYDAVDGLITVNYSGGNIDVSIGFEYENP